MDERPPSSASPTLERYRDGPPLHPRTYPDLHEHVLALAREGLLVIVDEPINKDTEMHPLVRWQYRGGIAGAGSQGVPVHAADRSQRPPLRHSVLVAGLAANRDVYRVGFGTAARKDRRGLGEGHRQSDPPRDRRRMRRARKS